MDLGDKLKLIYININDRNQKYLNISRDIFLL